jgi:hypothetical protein
MSIPLDRLYHYIENIAKEVRGDDVVIYRFYPHGSKKIDDLGFLSNSRITFKNISITPQIYCHDQEPLNYDFYTNALGSSLKYYKQEFDRYNLDWPDYNLKQNIGNIYDYSLLIHSEQRSAEVAKYQANFFIPVYYWNHAILAKDWFRYAEHQPQSKQENLQDFLIYNRAWSGTREYRLKFIDFLIDQKLVNHCRTSFNPQDPETKIEYTQHTFLNPQWKPDNIIEKYFDSTTASACCSADFDLEDYSATRFEVVLETLFDDQRLHLTEKSLRPLAIGQPFLLMASHGSLAYLRSYGFQTFNEVIDESYDLIENPYQRLCAVVNEMKRIASWSDYEKQYNLNKLQQITQYNRKHFFSKDFDNLIIQELRCNLNIAFKTLENKNSSREYFAMRKKLTSIPKIREELLSDSVLRTRQELISTIKKARQYYDKFQ